MPKNLASFICALGLLVVLLPFTIADNSQNTTRNDTVNITLGVALNEPANGTKIIAGNDSQENAKTATQLGAQNATSHTKVLRAGFEKAKPLNNLDMYGNKSLHNISPRASNGSAFNISQRLGNVSKNTYNTDIFKPIYNISQYSRTKPLYQVPDTLASKPVYSISGYPEIMATNSMP